MRPSAKNLVKRMKHDVVQFQYKKKGSKKLRKAKGTLDKSIVPELARKNKTGRHPKPDTVIYYDLERGAIRSFKDYLLQRVWQRSLKETDDEKPKRRRHHRRST